jgi:hypothetical protein
VDGAAKREEDAEPRRKRPPTRRTQGNELTMGLLLLPSSLCTGAPFRFFVSSPIWHSRHDGIEVEEVGVVQPTRRKVHISLVACASNRTELVFPVRPPPFAVHNSTSDYLITTTTQNPTPHSQQDASVPRDVRPVISLPNALRSETASTTSSCVIYASPPAMCSLRYDADLL